MRDKLHQHICAVCGHLFFPENTDRFLPAGKDNIQLLCVLKPCPADRPVTMPIDHDAALIRHPDRIIKRTLIHHIHVQRMEFQTGFFLHLAHSGIPVILVPFNQPCRQLIDIARNGIPVLTHKDNVIPSCSRKAEDHNAIRRISPCRKIQRGDVLRPGCHVIGSALSFPVGRGKLVIIQKTVMGNLCYPFNACHACPPTFSSANRITMPKTPQEITSPAPTVSI